jgi:ribosomal protein L37AE/L43A
MLTIKALEGRYLVTLASPQEGLQHFVVYKEDGEARCTCGKRRCPHIKAVREYIAAGGAPAKSEDAGKVREQLRLHKCPACQKGIVLRGIGTTWTCSEGSHVCFFQWKNDTHGDAVRKWLTGEGKKAWEQLTQGGTINA